MYVEKGRKTTSPKETYIYLHYITRPPRERRSPGTSEDVQLLAEDGGETQVEAERLPEAVVEAADPELHRAEAAASVEAVKATEAAQGVAQTTEDVLDELEAGQEHHPRAGQPCNGRQKLHPSPNPSPPSQSCRTVKLHEKDHHRQV